ncbi:MAG: hypothetical protein IT436_10480 [Phycisphaerales bacterium]|nr:hypothetical protein [Phycisphaerales bacterium]
MKKSLGVTAAIGAAVIGSAASGAEPGWRPARVAGRMYVNIATGEVVRTPEGPAARIGDIFWENRDSACGLAFAQDDPARDPAGGVDALGTLAVHWGDVFAESFVNGYEVAYATDIGVDTAGTGIAGLNMINLFIDDYDGVLDPGGAGATAIVAFRLEGIAGGGGPGAGALQAWVYTIDLEGSGYEITFGLTDVDGDGLHDFGYGFAFEQGQAGEKGIIGPVLTRPLSLGGAGTAYGCPDRFDWFNGFADVYAGGFWFGGGDCGASPPRPYASFGLTLFGPRGGCGGGGNPCCVLDYTEDGLVDFGDYLEFLNRYDAGDLSADFTADGLVDFADYLEFLNLYDACTA